jgi:hypothetical protein
MLSRAQSLASFHAATAGADVAVVEGVMGLYDGRDGATEQGSTAQMAKWLGAPVLLVLDCSALARSAAALAMGFAAFDRKCALAGLVLNKVAGASHGAWLRDAIAGGGAALPVLGAIPQVRCAALWWGVQSGSVRRDRAARLPGPPGSAALGPHTRARAALAGRGCGYARALPGPAPAL